MMAMSTVGISIKGLPTTAPYCKGSLMLKMEGTSVALPDVYKRQADAHAEHLEAHLGEQLDIILIGMIEIDTAALGQLPIFRVSLHVLHRCV